MKRSTQRWMTVALGATLLAAAACSDDAGSFLEVSSFSPGAEALAIPLNAKVSIAFSAKVDLKTINGDSFKISTKGVAVKGAIRAEPTGATFTPAAALASETQYVIEVTTAVASIDGQKLPAPFSWRFTTAKKVVDKDAPTVKSTTPKDKARAVSVNSAVLVTFSEDMDAASIEAKSFTLQQGATVVAGTVGSAGPSATFAPTAPLSFGLVYTAKIANTVKDVAGNLLAKSLTFTFTTGSQGDTTAPTVLSVTPAAKATSVAVDTPIKVTFNETVLPKTITTSTVALRTEKGEAVGGRVTASGAVVTFVPGANLKIDTSYIGVLATTITDSAGNRLATPYIWRFRTVDKSPPRVLSMTPLKDAKKVPVAAKVTVTFSEEMDGKTLTPASFLLADGPSAVSGTVTYAKRVATFTPTSALSPQKTYTAAVETSATDSSGNALPAKVRWTFTTADTTPPRVLFTSPTAKATKVPINAIVLVSFSESVDVRSVTGAAFSVKAAATIVNGRVGAAGAVASFVPTKPLAYGTLHTATLSTDITDVGGNKLVKAHVFTFTTGASPDLTAPTVVASFPVAKATKVTLDTTASVTFSEDMDPLSISERTVRVLQGTTAVAAKVTYASRVATIKPTRPLAPNAAHTIEVTASVRDRARNRLATPFTAGFDTLDNTAPRVVSTSPSDETAGVPLTASLDANFSEVMNATTVTATSFTLATRAAPAAPIAATVTIDATRKVATLKPTAALNPNVAYIATVKASIADPAGNKLLRATTFRFSTIDTSKPSLASTVPAAAATAVGLDRAVIATFTKELDPSTVDASSFSLKDGTTLVTATYSVAGKRAVLSPSAKLKPSTTYTVGLTTAIRDTYSNTLDKPTTLTFTTAAK